VRRRRRLALGGLLGLLGLLALVPPPLACPEPDPASIAHLVASAPAVQLWASPIIFLDSRAVHPHFLYTLPGDPNIHRVEIWQTAHGPHSHLLVDWISPLRDQDRGMCLLGERTGPDAEAVIDALQQAPSDYRWSDTYLPVPGPNSNTFATAILEQSGWDVRLPRQAIGQRFPLR